MLSLFKKLFRKEPPPAPSKPPLPPKVELRVGKPDLHFKAREERLKDVREAIRPTVRTVSSRTAETRGYEAVDHALLSAYNSTATGSKSDSSTLSHSSSSSCSSSSSSSYDSDSSSSDSSSSGGCD
jgi:hypothetical protein